MGNLYLTQRIFLKMKNKVELLLVDDDSTTLFIHEKILSKCTLNHPHISFSSGQNALNYILDEDNASKSSPFYLTSICRK